MKLGAVGIAVLLAWGTARTPLRAADVAERAAPPLRRILRTVPRGLAGPPAPAAPANLVYYGGPVVPSVNVVQVIWGSGTYLAGITNGGTHTPTRLGDFYRSVSASAYVDWLCEYNTPTQTVARGGFYGAITITPSPANDGSTITDAEIQAELVAQIQAQVLPYPDGNTIYMIDFPLGKTIDDGFGDLSCQVYCGYHGTGVLSGQYYYYAVLPDFSPGSGCDVGCGTAATLFDDLTSVSSHEMVEAITDPAVGQAPTLAAPLAWYDAINGEIGDICNQFESSFVDPDNVTWTVQKEWSNAFAACIAQKPNNPPIAQCQNATPSVFGCSASASIDAGSYDPDCWDTLQKSQSPPGPYPVGVTPVTLTVTDRAGATSSCSANVTVTSTGCDDGVACTTGDTCSGSVCAGTPGPPPAEVDSGLQVAKAGASATVSWNAAAGATASDVLRGLISALPVGPGGGDETCLGDNLSVTTVSDAAVPPAGDGYWYLARGESFCGNGTYGYSTQNATPTVERVSTTCP